jgi:hypothetical protein
MRGQHPAPGGGGDLLNEPRGDEVPRQCGAIPRGEAAAQRIRTRAGEAYHVDRDLRGKHHPWHRGQGRLRARPGAAPERVWPTCGPPSAEGLRRGPHRRASTQPPGGGHFSRGAPAPRRRWSTVASVPRSRAPRETDHCVKIIGGHVPSYSPPLETVRHREGYGIPVRRLTVKQMCIPFHDEL